MTPPSIQTGAANGQTLPPLLMTLAALVGGVATALWGNALGAQVQTTVFAVIGVAYSVYIWQHHATIRNDTTAAAQVATAKAAAGGGLSMAAVEAKVREVLSTELPAVEAALTGALQGLIPQLFPPGDVGSGGAPAAPGGVTPAAAPTTAAPEPATAAPAPAPGPAGV